MGTWIRMAGVGIILASVCGCGLVAFVTSNATEGLELDQQDVVWADATLTMFWYVGGFAVGVVLFSVGTYLSSVEYESEQQKTPEKSGPPGEPLDYDERLRKRKGRKKGQPLRTTQTAALPSTDRAVATAPDLPPLPLAGHTETDSGTHPGQSTATDPDNTRPRTADDAPPPSHTSSGHRYHLQEALARGGMGVVYRAVDVTFGREVAVKVVAPELAGGSAARRFVLEAELTGRLQHPFIPPVHDLGTWPDGSPYLAMKLIRGTTLAEELKARPTPADDLDRFVRIFEQVCQAVAYAHARRVIHRDLKPGNVMVGQFAEVQVMDWGLAKTLSEADLPPPADASDDGWRPDPEGRTKVGTILGTPAYMPPEQALGRVDEMDARADVFSLGGILCVILTGHPPYVAPTGRAAWELAAEAQLDDAFARLSTAATTNGAGRLVMVAKRCLSPQPGDRYAHAGEVAVAVNAARSAIEQWKRKDELEAAVETADRDAQEARWHSQRVTRMAAVVVSLSLLLCVVFGGIATIALINSIQGVKSTSRQRPSESSEPKPTNQQRKEEEREGPNSPFLPLVVTVAEQELATGPPRSGEELRRRAAVIRRVAAAVEGIGRPERGLGYAVLAGLYIADDDPKRADDAWKKGVEVYERKPWDAGGERLAVAAVRQFGEKTTPNELEMIILKRAVAELENTPRNSLPSGLRQELDAAIRKAKEKIAVK